MLDEHNKILNYDDARFRAFQYFRSQVDLSFSQGDVEPAFTPSEIEEPDWRKWED